MLEILTEMAAGAAKLESQFMRFDRFLAGSLLQEEAERKVAQRKYPYADYPDPTTIAETRRRLLVELDYLGTLLTEANEILIRRLDDLEGEEILPGTPLVVELVRDLRSKYDEVRAEVERLKRHHVHPDVVERERDEAVTAEMVSVAMRIGMPLPEIDTAITPADIAMFVKSERDKTVRAALSTAVDVADEWLRNHKAAGDTIDDLAEDLLNACILQDKQYEARCAEAVRGALEAAALEVNHRICSASWRAMTTEEQARTLRAAVLRVK